jgi:hypothetical protein
MRLRWTAFLLVILALLGTAFAPPPQSQAAPPPPGPDRYTVITVDYTAYTWWMANWSHNEVVCAVVADHEGPPTP